MVRVVPGIEPGLVVPAPISFVFAVISVWVIWTVGIVAVARTVEIVVVARVPGGVVNLATERKEFNTHRLVICIHLTYNCSAWVTVLKEQQNPLSVLLTEKRLEHFVYFPCQRHMRRKSLHLEKKFSL